MIHYDGRNKDYVIGKEWVHRKKCYETAHFTMRRHMSVLAQAKPRDGKSVISKDLCVKISHDRKVLIFDHNLEWARSVTKYNYKAESPDRLTGVKVLDRFTFPVTDFLSAADFASFGFAGRNAGSLARVLKKTKWFHRGDPDKITQIVDDIPIRRAQERRFRTKYQADIVADNAERVKTIRNAWRALREFFWQGEKDTRPIINFEEEFLKHDHLIVNFNYEPETVEAFVARTFFAKVLQKMWSVCCQVKPVIFIEEARNLIPDEKGTITYPSNSIMYSYVMDGPKEGIGVYVICQNENQIYDRLLEGIQERIIGRVNNPPSGDIFRVKLFRGRRSRKKDEFLYERQESSDNQVAYTKFVPCVPCMAFRSEK